jgi:hypothetical protein
LAAGFDVLCLLVVEAPDWALATPTDRAAANVTARLLTMSDFKRTSKWNK